MNIANYKPGILYSIYIASTPEKVWQALTSAEFSRQYFSGLAVEVEEKIGGAFVLRAPDGSVHISGEVVECDELGVAVHHGRDRACAGGRHEAERRGGSGLACHRNRGTHRRRGQQRRPSPEGHHDYLNRLIMRTALIGLALALASRGPPGS